MQNSHSLLRSSYICCHVIQPTWVPLVTLSDFSVHLLRPGSLTNWELSSSHNVQNYFFLLSCNAVCLLYLGTKRKPNLVNLTTKDFVNPLQITTSHHIALIASSDLNNTVQLVDIYNSSVACLWMSWIRVIPADGILLRTSEEEQSEDRSQPPEDLRLR